MCSLSLRPCIQRLIFCAFDTLVRPGFLFFSTVLCHDQFTARHMTAPSASEDLKDFVCNPSLPCFLSHIQNGHLYFYPALAAERDCVPASFFRLSDSRLLFGMGNRTESRPADTNRQLLFRGSYLSLRFQLREVGVSRVISQEQCVQRRAGERAAAF